MHRLPCNLKHRQDTSKPLTLPILLSDLPAHLLLQLVGRDKQLFGGIIHRRTKGRKFH